MSARTVTGAAAQAVLAELSDGARLTVGDLGRRTGLARSTVVNALRRLAEAGEIEQHQPGPSGRGRPSHRWSTRTPPGPVLVLVGAAHGTLAGLIAMDGSVVALHEAPPLAKTHEGRDASLALDAVDAVLSGVGMRADEVSFAVIGLPGPSTFTPTAVTDGAEPTVPSGHLRRLRTWDGTSPERLVAHHLNRPVYSENDVNLAALGEASVGAGRDRSTVLHVGLEHGTGAGLVIGGRLHRGRTGLAGEIGHLHENDAGRLCHCGARGCFWHAHSVEALLTSLAEAHGRPATFDDMSRAAETGDPDVLGALLDFGHALGRRVADAVVLLDPDVIVVDGSLG
ncbi:MAG TPA: ROK family transcriptional regulator, partial [Actinotalea sp.]|nr:ROK family transcriptional regulator [Actinotalea sp.]